METKILRDIVYEIRLMKQRHRHQYGELGKFICLDGNAEARMAAYLVYDSKNVPLQNTIATDAWSIDVLVEDILKFGIRNLDLKVCGMKLVFDCSSFCIRGQNGRTLILPH